VKLANVGVLALCEIFLKSSGDAERFAVNISSLGQMVPEKSKEMSMCWKGLGLGLAYARG